VTSQISIRLSQPATAAAVRCESRVVRAGRALVVQLIDVTDEATGRSLGAATMVSAVLQGGGGSHDGRARGEAPDVWTQRDRAGSDVSMDRWLRMEVVGREDDTMSLALPFHERLRNVVGVLHGGAQMVLVEHAALLAAAEKGAVRPVVDDLDVNLLAPGTVGPLTLRARLAGSQPGRMHFAVELADEGNDKRLVAVGLAGVSL
jgi:uncharacterized protein (TIGR00369 family)